MRRGLLIALLFLGGAAHAAAPGDEPGLEPVIEEPGLLHAYLKEAPVFRGRVPAFRLELAFGYASLLVDPEVGEGYGGGLFFAWGLDRRLGVELTVFFAQNPFEGELGSYGTAFLAGNLGLGPILQLTPPGGRVSLTADLGLGAYIIVPVMQGTVWTLGVSGGFTLALRLTRWLGIGVKWRYHLFNLATISGPEYRDLKALSKVGVIDRMEIPVYLAFYF